MSRYATRLRRPSLKVQGKRSHTPVFKQGSRVTFRNVTYRSRWELYVAKLLVYTGTQFQYEPQRFVLAEGITYLPDFYMPTYRAYIECKGSLSEKDIIQMRLFMKHHKLLYLGPEELKYVSGRNSLNFLSEESITDYIPDSGEAYRFEQVIQNPRVWRKTWD